MKFYNLFICLILTFFISQAYAGYCLTSQQIAGLKATVKSSCLKPGTDSDAYSTCATQTCNAYLPDNNVGTKEGKCSPNIWKSNCNPPI